MPPTSPSTPISTSVRGPARTRRPPAAGAHPDVPDARRSRGDRRLELRRSRGCACCTTARTTSGMWPKTLTDAPRRVLDVPGLVQQGAVAVDATTIRAVRGAARRRSAAVRDALPQLRRCIHAACFMPVPSSADGTRRIQTGLGLDWHYQLPFDPPFLVPDCRTRKFLVRRRTKTCGSSTTTIGKTVRCRRPSTSTQLEWMRRDPGEARTRPSVAFIGPSTPFLLQQKFMDIMTRAGGGGRGLGSGPSRAARRSADSHLRPRSARRCLPSHQCAAAGLPQGQGPRAHDPRQELARSLGPRRVHAAGRQSGPRRSSSCRATCTTATA